MDEPAVKLSHRRAPLVIGLAIAGLATIAIVIVVVKIVFGAPTDRPPTDADRKALADEVCPHVAVSHFYKIEKAGKVSYLLGTRHAGTGLVKYSKAVADAFASAQTCVFEADLVSPPPPITGKLPELETVEKLLGEDLWQRYRQLVGGDTADTVNHSVSAATARLAYLYEDIGQSVDLELEHRTKDEHKQLIALEDHDRSDHLSETYTGIDMLRESVRQIPRRELLEHETRRTLRLYCTGEGRQPDDHTKFGTITDARTRSWVGKLVPLLDGGGVFIAVGAAHVDEGEVKLGELLTSEGFTVTQVSP